MAALYAFDGANPSFDLKAAKKRGGIVATVYIVGTPGGMPHADKARVNAIRAAGMGALPNWERAADFFRTASLADCRNAGAEALAACRALGFPDDGTIGVAFSFDYEVPASGFAHATDQLKACGDGMGGHYVPLGYAQIDLINYWAAHGLPGPHWLMGSTWRSSSTFLAHEVGSPNVALVQSHDANGNWLSSPVAGTDINTVTQPERLLAWWPDNSPYGDNMPLSDADVQKVVNALLGKKIIHGTGADAIEATFASWVVNANLKADAAKANSAALRAELEQVQSQLAAFVQHGTLSVNSLPVTGTLQIGTAQ